MDFAFEVEAAGYDSLGGERGLSVAQSLTIPVGIATLRLFVWAPEPSGTGQDRLRLLVDGSEVGTVSETLLGASAGYREIELNLSSFADGGDHDLLLD